MRRVRSMIGWLQGSLIEPSASWMVRERDRTPSWPRKRMSLPVLAKDRGATDPTLPETWAIPKFAVMVAAVVLLPAGLVSTIQMLLALMATELKTPFHGIHARMGSPSPSPTRKERMG